MARSIFKEQTTGVSIPDTERTRTKRSIFTSPSIETETEFKGRKERFERFRTEAIEAERFAKKESSVFTLARRTFTGLPRAALGVGRDIAREIARSGGSIALELINEAQERGGAGDLLFEEGSIPQRISQFFFGDEPLESISTRIRRFPGRAAEFGIPSAAGERFAAPIILGLTVLDFLPGGKQGKEFLRQLVKQTDPKKVRGILESVKLPPKVLDDVAIKISKTKDPTEITKILDKSFEKLSGKRTVGNMIEVTNPRTASVFDKKSGTIKQVFRTDKLNITAKAVKDIENRLKALGLETRDIRTFGDMQRAAQELGLQDPRALLKEVSTNRITDKEVIGLRNLIKSETERIVRLNKQIAEIEVRGGKDSAIRVLNIKVNNADANVNTALKKLIKGGTEAGRTIAAFRIQASNTIDFDYWIRQARRLAGRDLLPDEKAAIFNLSDQKDRLGMAEFVSMLRKASFAEKAVTLWKAGLLTSPTTHLANILGTGASSALLTASDVASTGFDILAALVTTKRTTTISLATVRAKIRGSLQSFKSSKEFFKTGIYSENLLKKYDLRRQINFENKILDGYTKAIFRSLGAEDIFFRQGAMEESLEKSAIIIAKNERLTAGPAKARIGELLRKPTNEMIVRAIDDAERTTFTKANKLATMIQTAKRTGGPVLGSVAEVIVPFTQTPTNIAEMIIDFSPAGFLRALTRLARPSTRSQRDFVDRMGRAMTGTGIIAFGAYLGQKGILTSNAPIGAGERADFFASGKQPHAIRLGDTWYKLDRISPIGNLLTLGADFHDQSLRKEGVDLVVGTIGAGIKGLSEQTFLTGVRSAVEVLFEPELSGEKFVRRQIASVIPSVIGRIARTIDPTLRVSDNILDSVQAKLPGLTEAAPVRRDIFGNEVTVPGGRANLFDPFSSTDVVNNPILKEAQRLGLIIGLPSKTVSGIKMTEAEYSLYQEIQGKVLEEVLSAIISSAKYKKLSDSQKEIAFASAKRKVRSSISDLVFPAIMIERFSLPEGTNPDILKIVLKQLTQLDSFNKKSDDKKRGDILSILEQL